MMSALPLKKRACSGPWKEKKITLPGPTGGALSLKGAEMLLLSRLPCSLIHTSEGNRGRDSGLVSLSL